MKNILITVMLGFWGLSLFAQDNLNGIWKTDKDKILVSIEKQNDVFVGKVISSDNENAKPGTLLIKNLEPGKGDLEGQIYVYRRKEWHDATFKVTGNELKITVTLLFISKSVKWTKTEK